MALIADKNQVGEWLGWPTDKIEAQAATLERVVEAASRTIVRKTGRRFEPDNGATRIFELKITKRKVLVEDIRTASSVEWAPVGSTDWDAITDYRLTDNYQDGWPYRSVERMDGYLFSRGQLRVIGDWEWAAVPDGMQQATIMEAAKLLARAQSPKQVGSSFTGGETDLASFMDFDIEELINDYKVAQVA